MTEKNKLYLLTNIHQLMLVGMNQRQEAGLLNLQDKRYDAKSFYIYIQSIFEPMLLDFENRYKRLGENKIKKEVKKASLLLNKRLELLYKTEEEVDFLVVSIVAYKIFLQDIDIDKDIKRVKIIDYFLKIHIEEAMKEQNVIEGFNNSKNLGKRIFDTFQ